MLNGEIGYVGDGYSVAPLLCNGVDLHQHKALADRRNTFAQRCKWQVDAVIARGGVNRAALFWQAQLVAKLVSNQLALYQRQRFLLDIIAYIGGKCGRYVCNSHRNLQVLNRGRRPTI